MLSCAEQPNQAEAAQDNDEEEEDKDDTDDDEEMPAAARGPRARPPQAAAAADDVDTLSLAMGQASLSNGRPFMAFNFGYRFPVIMTVAGPLADGHTVVYADYLVPTLHPTRFNCTVSDDGLTATFGIELPSVFVDTRGRAEAGEHQVRGADESLFIAGARNTTDSIAALYPNIDSITPPGQQDPLPFQCRSRTDITHVFHEGDIRLNDYLASDVSFALNGVARQLYAFIRVSFTSLEAVRGGGSYYAINNQMNRSPQGRMYFTNGRGGGGSGLGRGIGSGGVHGGFFGSSGGGRGGQQSASAECERERQRSRSRDRVRNRVEFEDAVEEKEGEREDHHDGSSLLSL